MILEQTIWGGIHELREGIKTEVITVSAVETEDIAGYDPAQDRDLYEYYLAEERYYQEM